MKPNLRYCWSRYSCQQYNIVIVSVQSIMDFEQLRTLSIFAPPKKILAPQRSFRKKKKKGEAVARPHEASHTRPVDQPSVGESAISFSAKKSCKSQVAGRKFVVCWDTLFGHSCCLHRNRLQHHHDDELDLDCERKGWSAKS